MGQWSVWRLLISMVLHMRSLTDLKYFYKLFVMSNILDSGCKGKTIWFGFYILKASYSIEISLSDHLVLLHKLNVQSWDCFGWIMVFSHCMQSDWLLFGQIWNILSHLKYLHDRNVHSMKIWYSCFVPLWRIWQMRTQFWFVWSRHFDLEVSKAQVICTSRPRYHTAILLSFL